MNFIRYMYKSIICTHPEYFGEMRNNALDILSMVCSNTRLIRGEASDVASNQMDVWFSPPVGIPSSARLYLVRAHLHIQHRPRLFTYLLRRRRHSSSYDVINLCSAWSMHVATEGIPTNRHKYPPSGTLLSFDEQGTYVYM